MHVHEAANDHFVLPSSKGRWVAGWLSFLTTQMHVHEGVVAGGADAGDTTGPGHTAHQQQLWMAARLNELGWTKTDVDTRCARAAGPARGGGREGGRRSCCWHCEKGGEHVTNPSCTLWPWTTVHAPGGAQVKTLGLHTQPHDSFMGRQAWLPHSVLLCCCSFTWSMLEVL